MACVLCSTTQPYSYKLLLYNVSDCPKNTIMIYIQVKNVMQLTSSCVKGHFLFIGFNGAINYKVKSWSQGWLIPVSVA